MTDEAIIQYYLEQGRRKCLDYLIDTHRGSPQTINMQGLAMTDLELATWCKDVAFEIKEQLTTA